MPLIHSKTPAAFKKNIATEVEHGKPEKQAVAIAYSERRQAEHKKHLAMGGSVDGCSMCEGGYADGGEVEDTGPMIDQSSAAQIQKGATESGYQPGTWIKNVKEGLGLAEGGEVEPEMGGDMDVEDELQSMLGDELMSAFESKDRKRVMEGLEALIMSCMNKRGEQ